MKGHDSLQWMCCLRECTCSARFERKGIPSPYINGIQYENLCPNKRLNALRMEDSM